MRRNILREYLQEKGHLWKEIQRNWSDRTWSWNCQIISGRIPMPTSGVMFEKKRRNFHRRMTIGIHMLGLVECWQIFHGSRPTVCSEKESHQKGICNPWNLCWTCKIHTIREAIFGFPPFCSNGLFPPLLFSAIAHEFPLAACGRPFFVPYHPGNLCLPVGPFGSLVLVVQRRERQHPRGNRALVSSVVQRRSVIDVFIHRDGAR